MSKINVLNFLAIKELTRVYDKTKLEKSNYNLSGFVSLVYERCLNEEERAYCFAKLFKNVMALNKVLNKEDISNKDAIEALVKHTRIAIDYRLNKGEFVEELHPGKVFGSFKYEVFSKYGYKSERDFLANEKPEPLNEDEKQIYPACLKVAKAYETFVSPKLYKGLK